MLKGIPKVLSPELLKTLSEMGHTDTLVLGDANFTGEHFARESGCKMIRADGIGAKKLLDAILKVIPLDTDDDTPVMLMECDKELEIPIWDEYKSIVLMYYPDAGVGFYERQKFYREAKKAYCIVQTGEEAIYANVIIKKGVIV
jgi:L-fucose mutarotase